MKGRISHAIVASAALLTATAAVAQSNNTYFSPEISYHDSEEFDLGSGIGIGFSYGADLTRFVSLEGLVDFSTIAYEGPGSFDDYQRTRLGLRGLVFPFTRDLKVAPFISAGGYGHYIDAFGENFTGASTNAGLGLLMRGEAGADLRLEAKYNVDYLQEEGPVLKDEIEGWQVGLAVNYRLGYTKPTPVVAAPVPPPAPKPTCDGVIKNGLCIGDSDRDGIYDDVDRCPGTPGGVKVTADGCPLDSDKDGVADYLDRCPNTVLGLKVDANGCAAQAQSVPLKDVEFELNSSVLTAVARAKLVRIVDAMKGQPSMRVRLEGHTDSSGSDAYNLDLSKKRARSVYNFLVGAGIATNRLESEGYGESKPVESNATTEGRAQNRRVEFKVIGQ